MEPMKAEQAGLTPEEMERVKAAGLPDGAEVYAMDFDPEAFVRKYPEVQRGCVHVLEAFQKENPTMPREVCAILAMQFMELVASPMPGCEQAFYADLDWLRQQQGRFQMQDGTGGTLQAAKDENRKDWRQT